MTRVCFKCGLEKPLTNDYWQPRTHARHRFQSPCRSCMVQQSKDWDAALKRAALEHYSSGTPTCACCGDTTYEFMSIDHIDGGGLEHRRQLGGGGRLFRWLKKMGYPSGFRVLCFNCNLSRGMFGYCPHERKLKAVK